ncbi:MAG: hypothetical protein ABR548_04085 [Actinomycetota bacterium]
MTQRMATALREEESGFALIISIILMGVIGTLVALTLTVGTHSDFSTGRGRNFVEALHVAESGVEHAISKLQSTGGGFAGTFTGSINEGGNEGTYTVTVTKLARKRYQIDAAASVGTGGGLKTKRKLRVTMAPPPAFKYALFSYTSVSTKNNDLITGDIWANENITVDEGDTVDGSVTAARGYIHLANGSRVKGDAWSGWFDDSNSYAIHLDNNAIIDGNAKASVTAPTDPVTGGGENLNNYTVRLETGSSVGKNVTTWGTKTGPGTVGGVVANNVCTAAPASKPLPVFTYSDLNYDPATLHQFGTAGTPSATAVSDFQTYVAGQGKHISGTFYINQAAPVNQDNRIDLTNVVITGDTTIISNAPIFTNGVADDTNDAIFVLVSTYQPPVGTTCDLNQDKSECSIHLKNNFQPSGKTAVLIYAPYGPVAVKNNQVQFGSIYADEILVKDNQQMTYDSRVERVVGFGPDTYEIQQWLELNP